MIQGSDLERLYNDIVLKMEPSPRVQFSLSVHDATSMFEILSVATFCVNYKLHASISCLAAGAYPLEVPYSRKWEDWIGFLQGDRDGDGIASGGGSGRDDGGSGGSYIGAVPPVVVGTDQLTGPRPSALSGAFFEVASLFGLAEKSGESGSAALTEAQGRRRLDFAVAREKVRADVRQAYVSAADKFLREEVGL